MNGRDISWVSLELFHPQNMEGQLTPTYSEEKGQPCRYDQVGRFPHLQSLFGLYCFPLYFCSMQVSKTEPITNQLFSPPKKKHESFDGHHELRTTTPEGESRELTAWNVGAHMRHGSYQTI